MLAAGRFRPADPVLVIGATGGVGTAVVPLLAAARVHVVATARPDAEAYVRNLGAADVIDHGTADLVTETAARHPDGLAGVVNLALPGDRLTAIAETIHPGGHLVNVAYPSPDPATFPRADLTVETVFTRAVPGDLAELAAQAVGGTMPAAIGGRYALADASRAYHDPAHTHTLGKLVVVPGPANSRTW